MSFRIGLAIALVTGMKHIHNRIEEHMTEHPCFASRSITVLEADEFMKTMGFRHLPVVEDGKVVGVVSERDLKQAKAVSGDIRLTLEDIMIQEPYCVTVGTPLSKVVEVMANKKYGSSVVLNDEGAVVGIFTTTDAMHVLSKCMNDVGIGTLYNNSVEKFLAGNVLI